MSLSYRLENALRNFACLTTGDVIAINYNEKVNQFIQIGLACEYDSILFYFYWIPLQMCFFFFQIYELRVMETKPDKAVSIIECDMNVRPATLSQTTMKYCVVFSALNVLSLCFSGGFWCSFGLQRAWTTTSAPRRTNSKDPTVKVAQHSVFWTNW